MAPARKTNSWPPPCLPPLLPLLLPSPPPPPLLLPLPPAIIRCCAVADGGSVARPAGQHSDEGAQWVARRGARSGAQAQRSGTSAAATAVACLASPATHKSFAQSLLPFPLDLACTARWFIGQGAKCVSRGCGDKPGLFENNKSIKEASIECGACPWSAGRWLATAHGGGAPGPSTGASPSPPSHAGGGF
jgi:hypothetical protein